MIDKAGSFMYNNFCVIDVDAKIKYWQCRTSDMEKYSRGRRGAPAKGVGRVTGARVQIPLSPFIFNQKTTEQCPVVFAYKTFFVVEYFIRY